MVANAQPSRNPVNDDTLTGTLKEVLRKFLQNTDDMLPAEIVSYDRATNIAVVKPLIQVLTTENELVPRAVVPGIRVFLMGGGGHFVSFNLPPGSLGWIKANDRDISLFLQNMRDEAPNTFRMHSFSDAVFFPQIMAGYSIDDEDSEAMVIQNLDGSVRLSLNDQRIKITAPLVEIDAAASNFTGNINAEGDINSDGTINAVGDINSDGTVTGTVDVIGAGVTLSTRGPN